MTNLDFGKSKRPIQANLSANETIQFKQEI